MLPFINWEDGEKYQTDDLTGHFVDFSRSSWIVTFLLIFEFPICTATKLEIFAEHGLLLMLPRSGRTIGCRWMVGGSSVSKNSAK
jgi:hypothetical protein